MLQEKITQTQQKEKQNIIPRFQNLETILLSVGALLAIMGSFMTWGQAVTVFGNLNVSGIMGDGKITALMGALIITLVVLDKTMFYEKTKIQKILPYIYFLLIVIALGVVVSDAVGMSKASNEFVKAAAGSGMYVVFLGGVLVASSVIITLIKLKNKIAALILLSILAVIIVGVGFAASQRSTQTATESKVSTSENTTDNKPKPKIDVVSKYFQKGANGIPVSYVMGELKNTGDSDAYLNNVTVSLLSGGKVVASTEAMYKPDMVAKGEIVLYQAMIDNPPAYDDINVGVDAKSESNSKISRLDVVSQTPRDGDYGMFSVAGEIENKTAKDYQSVHLYVWLLDTNNNVIGVEATYVENVSKGIKKPYEVRFNFSPTEPKPNIKTIKVLAEGRD